MEGFVINGIQPLDHEPTAGSYKPVMSDGLKTALDGKVSGSGNIGSDSKPIKIVAGVATAVTDDLEPKIGLKNLALITYTSASISNGGNWNTQSGSVYIPPGASDYFEESSGKIKLKQDGLYLMMGRLVNNISQYEGIFWNNNVDQNVVHNSQICSVQYLNTGNIIAATLYGAAGSGSFEQYNRLNCLFVVKL